MKIQKNFLQWSDVIKDVRNHCENIEDFLNFNDKEKQEFLNSEFNKVENYLNQAIWIIEGERGLEDMDLKFIFIGIFLEKFIKFLIMIKNFNSFLLTYYNLNDNGERTAQSFNYYKKQVVKDLKEKKDLNKKHIERIEHIIYYFQFQRNNFIHGHYRGFDYNTEKEFYLLILVLLKIYKLSFEGEKTNSQYLIKKIEEDKKEGLDFEDIGLLDFINEKKSYFKEDYFKSSIIDRINEEFDKKYDKKDLSIVSEDFNREKWEWIIKIRINKTQFKVICDYQTKEIITVTNN